MAWAGLTGPASWSSAYKNSWARGVSGVGLDASSDPTAIIIAQTGQYEVTCMQRGNGSNGAYLALALNGDRISLQTRPTGIYTHDHSSGFSGYSNGTYIGLLNAGERITAGAPDTGTRDLLIFGSDSVQGALIVKRIG
jgi:hypothetical protein